MSRFKTKKNKGATAINTSSLPDIIFMLLFFFMVTTVMREVSLKVKLKLPEATEIQKLEKKSLVSYIYIGPPVKSALYGTNSRIQLNDTFASVDDIQEFVAKEREDRDEADRKFITTSLKIDGITKMGIVTDVKQELRKAGALKINYSTRKGRDQK
ncbi:MAG: biopolymer transporter ExbD [Lentimicrobiaceae bacterium]|jgi:biopolymer transport protein ExbD|nr:biopolymer transporter ExbD [Lentimicrobiaceae bacterium]MCP4910141.1 biopolymer transporter ExbD [Bacteroidota bacterium]MBT3454806.1 biopolymer transporter ExbD [Lentimicrobiaceae bacterium]MBT3817805.1 biopolymer transporter ExbD [Lentimicrobiaceae bacterium]MBT4061166.1 biopolymer transporter ExbD [Lentimicrobiaceae bacterium]